MQSAALALMTVACKTRTQEKLDAELGLRAWGNALTASYLAVKWRHAFCGAAAAVIFAGTAAAADLSQQTPLPLLSDGATAYNWTGFYLGAHEGYAFGSAKFTATNAGAPGGVAASGHIDLYEPFDPARSAGSWFNGLQGGYNYMFRSGVVIGAEADLSASSWVNQAGFNIGGIDKSGTYLENVFASGTVRGRLGYAYGAGLWYVTGGLAWATEQMQQLATGDSSYITRLGWSAGGGVEAPLIPNWTVRAEYLYTHFGSDGVYFPAAAQHYKSVLNEDQVRVGVNYQFGDYGASAKDAQQSYLFNPNDINIHAQSTLVWQGVLPFSSNFTNKERGARSAPNGQGDEINDTDLYVGFRLWKGAELWFNPQIDQGSGLGGTTGFAQYPNGEAFKFGFSQPYARVNRLFIRQTIDLGGDSQDVAPDMFWFPGTTTSDRLVLTAGMIEPLDIFDTNSYAGNSKSQFLNWASMWSYGWDFPCNSWGYGYGAVAEWYHGNYTFRAGIFDESQQPESGISPFGQDLDPMFRQFDAVVEIERRHELWGEPGKVKILFSLARDIAGKYIDAVDYALAHPSVNGGIPDTSFVRHYLNKPAIALNAEQQIAPGVGAWLRASITDPAVEILQTADNYAAITGGFTFSGTLWNRDKDSFGIMLSESFASHDFITYLKMGGQGAEIGDGINPVTGVGNLVHAAPERVFETYYNYSVTPSLSVSLDYQLIGNIAYNADRGPANIIGTRIHWQF